MTYNVKCPVFMESGGINVTSPFGWRIHPISGKGEGHKGTDITRWTGYSNVATITAFAAGKVTAIKDTVPGIDTGNAANSAGNYVIIDHGGGWVTKYFHLRHGSIVVFPGDYIEAGEIIGSMGKLPCCRYFFFNPAVGSLCRLIASSGRSRRYRWRS